MDISLPQYNIVINKKINDAILFGIPNGIKCIYYIWNDEHIVIESNQSIIRYKNLIKKENINGTALYGTYFVHKNEKEIFCIEDIFYWKNENTKNKSWFEKYELISIILNNKLIKGNLHLCVPIMAKSNNSFLKLQQGLQYSLKEVQYRNLLKVNEMKIMDICIYNDPSTREIKKDESTEVIQYKKFIVKPDINCDIYHLYSLKNTYVGIAGIPDYKTSVYMNSIFRNIKENINLDYLFESDDEEEFQDNNPYKYVKINKVEIIKFYYNKKFNQWIPCIMR